jgi:hypothetical protein
MLMLIAPTEINQPGNDRRRILQPRRANTLSNPHTASAWSDSIKRCPRLF